jgi:monoamine oxidase
MPRTPIFALLRRSFRLAKTANKQHITAAEALERQAAAAYSRRAFLKQGGLATLALGVPSLLISACKKDEVLTPTTVAIIGGGIAGLNCAYELKKAGYNSTVYEAAKRTGGRMFTAKDIMAPGLTTELGGEFIDTAHTTILKLANEFSLPILDTMTIAESLLTRNIYYFGGQFYNEQQIVDAFMPIAAAMQADIDSLPDECDYKHAAQLSALDNISISQYLTNIGATGTIKVLIEQAFMGEFGLEANEQSAVNLLSIISTDTTAGKLELYGESDERYKIVGGNQQIPDKVAASLNPGQIRLEHRLIEIKTNASGQGYLLFFDVNGSTLQVQADLVVMTLPFSILKSINLAVPISPQKRYAINNLGYGTNAKLMLGMNTRPWRNSVGQGYFYSDMTIQQGWDNAQMQNGNNGAAGITLFSGGQNGINVGTGTAASQAAAQLPKLDLVLVGAAAAFNGKSERMHWPSHPFSLGSYAAFRVGQYQTVAGREIETVDENIFFAGEHTSLEFQGYMNGGAYSGELAAKEVLKKLKK